MRKIQQIKLFKEVTGLVCYYKLRKMVQKRAKFREKTPTLRLISRMAPDQDKTEVAKVRMALAAASNEPEEIINIII